MKDIAHKELYVGCSLRISATVLWSKKRELILIKIGSTISLQDPSRSIKKSQLRS